MRRLEFEDGTRAAAEGKDLAAVARRLSDDELSFWIGRFAEMPFYNERRILEAEARRRGEDWLFGPLFRNLEGK